MEPGSAFICEVKMKITEFLENNILLLDGAMGTLLQEKGLAPGEPPEKWCISHPDTVKDVHLKYYEAGSDAVLTNTFGVSLFKYERCELEDIISSAVDCAREAAKEAKREGERFVALDIGPTGKMLKPYGELDFESAVANFKLLAGLGEKYGADFIFIETMSDSYESKAALLGAKEGCSIPIFLSNAYDLSGNLMTGASPAAMVAMLEGMGADAIGINCSFGPNEVERVAKEYLDVASVPFILKPNAGLPRVENERTVYDLSPTVFADALSRFVKLGARIVGGCCGTSPEHIKELARQIKGLCPAKTLPKNVTRVASFTHSVEIGEKTALIGERINPTGKKRFKEALKTNDLDYILSEGVAQQDGGADILDVNVGLPEIDEPSMLTRVVKELQAVCDLPLCLDSSDPCALSAAMRVYNGKPLVNSVNGKKESMEAIFPLVKKYGGVLIALTLDENGIPSTAAGRVKIAKKILEEAAKYGIEKKDIIFDPLAMAVSADKSSARECLEALRVIKHELGAGTSLGISNISFGLPNRDDVNGAFLSMAISSGLSAAIINPLSEKMMGAYRTSIALKGLDEGFEHYIRFAQSKKEVSALQSAQATVDKTVSDEHLSELGRAVARGLRERARELTRSLLVNKAATEVIDEDIVPALCEVGRLYEQGRAYLPTLLMSAEAAEASLSIIKEHTPTGRVNNGGVSVLLATVKGDVHDIGKNIVKMMIESFGFTVYDLGKDVSPEKIAEAAIEKNVRIVGLSALMTTTLPAMEETVKLIRKKKPYTKIMVGGAVLTEEYAEKIGADFYAKDAMDGVRFVEQIDAEMRAEIFG